MLYTLSRNGQPFPSGPVLIETSVHWVSARCAISQAPTYRFGSLSGALAPEDRFEVDPASRSATLRVGPDVLRVEWAP